MPSKRDRINQEWNAVKSDQHTGFLKNHNGEIRMLEKLLADDEPIEAWLPADLIPESNAEEVDEQNREGVLVATGRRVLFAKFWSGMDRSVVLPYPLIEGVHQSQKEGWTMKTNLNVAGSGSTSIRVEVPESRNAIRDFVGVVNQHILDAYSNPDPTAVHIQQPSIMEELDKAADLHARGILSDAEFQAIKDNLLSQM